MRSVSHVFDQSELFPLDFAQQQSNEQRNILGGPSPLLPSSSFKEWQVIDFSLCSSKQYNRSHSERITLQGKLLARKRRQSRIKMRTVLPSPLDFLRKDCAHSSPTRAGDDVLNATLRQPATVNKWDHFCMLYQSRDALVADYNEPDADLLLYETRIQERDGRQPGWHHALLDRDPSNLLHNPAMWYPLMATARCRLPLTTLSVYTDRHRQVLEAPRTPSGQKLRQMMRHGELLQSFIQELMDNVQCDVASAYRVDMALAMLFLVFEAFTGDLIPPSYIVSIAADALSAAAGLPSSKYLRLDAMVEAKHFSLALFVYLDRWVETAFVAEWRLMLTALLQTMTFALPVALNVVASELAGPPPSRGSGRSSNGTSPMKGKPPHLPRLDDSTGDRWEWRLPTRAGAVDVWALYPTATSNALTRSQQSQVEEDQIDADNFQEIVRWDAQVVIRHERVAIDIRKVAPPSVPAGVTMALPDGIPVAQHNATHHNVSVAAVSTSKKSKKGDRQKKSPYDALKTLIEQQYLNVHPVMGEEVPRMENHPLSLVDAAPEHKDKDEEEAEELIWCAGDAAMLLRSNDAMDGSANPLSSGPAGDAVSGVASDCWAADVFQRGGVWKQPAAEQLRFLDSTVVEGNIHKQLAEDLNKGSLQGPTFPPNAAKYEKYFTVVEAVDPPGNGGVPPRSSSPTTLFRSPGPTGHHHHQPPHAESHDAHHVVSGAVFCDQQLPQTLPAINEMPLAKSHSSFLQELRASGRWSTPMPDDVVVHYYDEYCRCRVTLSLSSLFRVLGDKKSAEVEAIILFGRLERHQKHHHHNHDGSNDADADLHNNNSSSALVVREAHRRKKHFEPLGIRLIPFYTDESLHPDPDATLNEHDDGDDSNGVPQSVRNIEMSMAVRSDSPPPPAVVSSRSAVPPPPSPSSAAVSSNETADGHSLTTSLSFDVFLDTDDELIDAHLRPLLITTGGVPLLRHMIRLAREEVEHLNRASQMDGDEIQEPLLVGAGKHATLTIEIVPINTFLSRQNEVQAAARRYSMPQAIPRVLLLRGGQVSDPTFNMRDDVRRVSKKEALQRPTDNFSSAVSMSAALMMELKRLNPHHIVQMPLGGLRPRCKAQPMDATKRRKGKPGSEIDDLPEADVTLAAFTQRIPINKQFLFNGLLHHNTESLKKASSATAADDYDDNTVRSYNTTPTPMGLKDGRIVPVRAVDAAKIFRPKEQPLPMGLGTLIGLREGVSSSVLSRPLELSAFTPSATLHDDVGITKRQKRYPTPSAEETFLEAMAARVMCKSPESKKVQREAQAIAQYAQADKFNIAKGKLSHGNGDVRSVSTLLKAMTTQSTAPQSQSPVHQMCCTPPRLRSNDLKPLMAGGNKALGALPPLKSAELRLGTPLADNGRKTRTDVDMPMLKPKHNFDRQRKKTMSAPLM